MPEIPICVSLVQSNHDYGLVESFPNMNSSQQTLDLTHLSIIFRSVAEATIEYARKSVWFFGEVGVALNFRALCARSFNRTPLREILDPPLRNRLRECTEGCRRAGIPFSSTCSLRFLGLSAIVGALGSIDR